MEWHTAEIAQVLTALGSDPSRGLTQTQVAAKRAESGENELVDSSGRGMLEIFVEQWKSAMILLLVGAAILSLALSEYIDTVAILAIVLLNAILGFVQDYRAERALAALKKLAVPRVRVRRDGAAWEISARELVPGDIVLLEVGNLVPADCRVIESFNLKVQEAALTGESAAVDKTVPPLSTAHKLPVADRTNMTYMGTTISYGHGTGVVTAIGMGTELGHIAQSLHAVRPETTPLQLRLAQLGRTLALVALGIVAVILVLGILAGEDRKQMLLTAMSMAVAVVPEGLPAVATVALALGARRMFKRHALIRKLPAVETLGSVTVICSDKTGTLTENQMTVTVLDVAGDRLDLTEQLQRDAAFMRFDDDHIERAASCSTLSLLLAGGALCNDAELELDQQQRVYRAVGDPTEAALAIAAARMGMPKTQLCRIFPRIGEIPFDSLRKRMTTIHRVAPEPHDDDQAIRQALADLISLDRADDLAITKGAADSILAVSEYIWDQGQTIPLDDSLRERIQRSHNELAASGMRVLGVALRPIDSSISHDDAAAVENELIFVGLFGMIDPPRREVKEAVTRCRTAGIRPLMITGDHPLTALHIARQLNITVGDQDRVVTGQELEALSDAALEQAVSSVSVYARVAPRDKLRIVQALQRQGQIVAMTGDGVNDAPALKQAHIGVAMGQVGTDVSKEAAAMVLLDDNFSTIVNAVEEGRMVYDNIRKFVKYTMTSNAGEIWVMVLGPLLGMPLPLLPLQILWVNLVTDGLPGLALAVEHAERNTMQRPPYPRDEHVFGRGMARDIAWIGLLMGVVSLSLGYWHWRGGETPLTYWRTLVFTVLTLSQMGNAMATRSQRDSLFTIGVFSNGALIGSVLLTFVLQLAVIYLPLLQSVFKTTALTATDLLLCIALSAVVFWCIEAKKFFARRTS